MVSKKKVVTRILKKHREWGRGPEDSLGKYYIGCECGWMSYAYSHEKLDYLWAEHVYFKLKKALKKQKKISLLLKE